MSDDTITIEINGQEIATPPGRMIIEVADAEGIEIPRFCYHKKLSVAANCRMCMVEVEKAPKPLPACATPVTDGMKIFTESEVARDAQKGTMEFLLINHPLDCPICDQGGECELQDVAVTYGGDVSRYAEAKREVPDPDLGPLIATDMNRCIHCTRCVRFGAEIAGVRELGATGRGEFVRIGTFIEKSVNSELSGNVVDVCPVGALTAKPSRFKFRPWELVETSSVAAHDCIGSNLSVHLNKGKITRVIPAENEAVNECWISDRDRFSYSGLYSKDRVTTPQMKMNGKWQQIGWEAALQEAAKRIQAYASSMGTLVSPSATTEELYLLQKMTRALGSHSIDHRLRQTDFRNQENMPAFPALGTSLEALDQHDAVFLIGSNVRKDQPIAGLKLRKASLGGASIMALNPRDYDFYFDLDTQLIRSPAEMVAALAGVVDKSGISLPQELASVKPEHSDEAEAIAKQLNEAENALILLGPTAINHPDQSILAVLASLLAEKDSVSVGYLPEGANTAGACLAGALPHRQAGGGNTEILGMNAAEMLSEGCQSYMLFNIEPEFDCANPVAALKALNSASSVVVFATHSTVSMYEYADLILPIAAASEKAGSMINAAGLRQEFKAATHPPEEARSGWAVLRMLGVMAGVEGFEYNNLAEIQAEVAEIIPEVPEVDCAVKAQSGLTPKLAADSGSTIQRYSESSIYGVDPVVRRSRPLLATSDAIERVLVAAADAERLQIESGDVVKIEQDGATVELPAEIDGQLPAGNVCLFSGSRKLSKLGASYASIQLSKV